MPSFKQIALAVILASTTNTSSVCAFTPSTKAFIHHPSILHSTKEESEQQLPDYGTTSVDIASHTLPPISAKWRRRDLDGQSLVSQTLEEIEDDTDFQETAAKLAKIGIDGMTKEERTRRRRALDSLNILSFDAFIDEKKVETSNMARTDAQVLQLNIGLYCNQACGHCHVESSPLRKQEMMDAKTASQCLEILKNSPSIHTLDITGGAPELNDSFRYIVSTARALRPDIDIIDRCNLTVMHEPGQEDLVSFLKEHNVHVVASLPCYSAENVDKQRGNGVFERSISALLALNEAGYGITNTEQNTDTNELQLDLVYNPLGAFLPPPQSSLESKYKEELYDNFGISFDSLFTMTNMPIKRFADFLYRRDELKDYMDLLVRNFNVDTTKSLMCLNTISVGYDGKIFDCDFNQQLGYGTGTVSTSDDEDDEISSTTTTATGKTVFDITSVSELTKIPIRHDNHCFGCTAGMGSS
uniref:DUF3641 domain-containing protein n=2 Tax=Ditylum brightwellii TaxID=49249 RepID=A0A7S2ECP4_9STRA